MRPATDVTQMSGPPSPELSMYMTWKSKSVVGFAAARVDDRVEQDRTGGEDRGRDGQDEPEGGQERAERHQGRSIGSASSPHPHVACLQQGTRRAGPRMVARSGVGQWYVGPGRAGPPGEPPHRAATCRGASCHRWDAVRGGAGRSVGRQAHPRYPPRGHTHCDRPRARYDMHLSNATVPTRGGRDSVMGGTLVGTLLVVGGLWLAYVAWSTPILAAITALLRPGSATPEPGLPMLAVALAVPAVFVVVGTNRLARTVTAVRSTWHGRGDRLSRVMPGDIVLSRDVTLDDGRLAPTLLVGPFGIVAASRPRSWSKRTWTGPFGTRTAFGTGSLRTIRISWSGSTPRSSDNRATSPVRRAARSSRWNRCRPGSSRCPVSAA